jgi:hypothetical protein
MRLDHQSTVIVLTTPEGQTVHVTYTPTPPPAGLSGKTWHEVVITLRMREISRQTERGNPSLASARHLTKWAIRNLKINDRWKEST